MFVSANKVEQPIAAEGMIKAKEEKKTAPLKVSKRKKEIILKRMQATQTRYKWSTTC